MGGGGCSDPQVKTSYPVPGCYLLQCHLVNHHNIVEGHRTSVSTCVPDEEALLAVCRSAYSRIMASLPGNVSAAQLAVAEELRKAGFELDEDNEELIARLPTIFAALDDGRRGTAGTGHRGLDAELAPESDSTVVFRDSAFADDVAKTNLAAILQQHGLENVRAL